MLHELRRLLDENENASLCIILPSGDFVPAHFHITEVGKRTKAFVDCGGDQHEEATCYLQVWVANDIEHRLTGKRLAQILKYGETIFGTEDLPVEIEYGTDLVSHYSLQRIVNGQGCLFLRLAGKQTDCLAPDKCGVTKCGSKGCC